MLRVLLLAVVFALALAAGAWALFLHSVDHGDRITVGALEDAPKVPDPKLADDRVAFASRAGFNALNITTAWTPGQTQPDPGELQLLRNVANASVNHHLQLLITVYAPRPRYAPMTDAQQDVFAGFMASLARDLPTVDGFAVWNEPNLNSFWLYQYDDSRQRHRRAGLRRAARPHLRRAQGRLAEDQGLRRQPRAARLRRPGIAAPDALADAVHP